MHTKCSSVLCNHLTIYGTHSSISVHHRYSLLKRSKPKWWFGFENHQITAQMQQTKTNNNTFTLESTMRSLRVAHTQKHGDQCQCHTSVLLRIIYLYIFVHALLQLRRSHAFEIVPQWRRTIILRWPNGCWWIKQQTMDHHINWIKRRRRIQRRILKYETTHDCPYYCEVSHAIPHSHTS